MSAASQNTEPLRLMLDQNFPLQPSGMRFDRLDKSVRLEHFNTAFPAYARVSTPDWKMYLLAKSGGFDAVITSDVNQLDEDVEMIVLQLTKLGLITWKRGEPDTVILYGQLLAYMPQVGRELRQMPASVVTLPTASIRRPDHVNRPGDLARKRHRHDGKSYAERKSQTISVVRADLAGTADEHLLDLLG
ncbi:MAG TPA: hypothetical protein VGH43_18755 [Jatrophihabitans sp.]|jgi:hypothetical protein